MQRRQGVNIWDYLLDFDEFKELVRATMKWKILKKLFYDYTGIQRKKDINIQKRKMKARNPVSKDHKRMMDQARASMEGISSSILRFQSEVLLSSEKNKSSIEQISSETILPRLSGPLENTVLFNSSDSSEISHPSVGLESDPGLKEVLNNAFKFMAIIFDSHNKGILKLDLDSLPLKEMDTISKTTIDIRLGTLEAVCCAIREKEAIWSKGLSDKCSSEDV